MSVSAQNNDSIKDVYKRQLLYIEEHRSCQNYMTTIETGFKYLEFAKNAAFEEAVSYTHLVS